MLFLSGPSWLPWPSLLSMSSRSSSGSSRVRNIYQISFIFLLFQLKISHSFSFFFFLFSFFFFLFSFSFSFSFLFLLPAIGFLTYSGVNVKKYGKWAVVTGATDGIGLGSSLVLYPFPNKEINSLHLLNLSSSQPLFSFNKKLPGYAQQLAKKGLDVVLISRSAEKLKE